MKDVMAAEFSDWFRKTRRARDRERSRTIGGTV